MEFSFGSNLIPEVTVPWVRAQQMGQLIPGSIIADLKRCADRVILEDPPRPPDPEYIIEEANWDLIAEEGKLYNPAVKTGKPADLCWEFACALYNKFHLSAKDAMRALREWSAKYHVLALNKLKQILSNARNTAGSNAPSSLWQTDRWIREKSRREHNREMFTRAARKLETHISGGGWNVGITEHDKLACRQIENWIEGRSRCGNSYWWIRYQSPGLEEIPGVKTYCKTCHACGSPGCPECALQQTEREVAEWDWQAAYGIRFPKILDLWVSREFDVHDLKSLISKLTKRQAGMHLEGCFGAFVPTPEGYRLRIMVPGTFTRYAQAELCDAWVEVCRKYADKLGQSELRDSDLPAEEMAVELILKAERELFELVDRDRIDLPTAWKWFSAWIGSKPGSKGMNRVWHGPGFRKFRLPEITPNMEEDDMLDVNSDDDDEEKFPRTWMSLESNAKKGFILKVFDPYLEQVVYMDPGDRLSAIPSEYKTEDGKPLNRKDHSKPQAPGSRLISGPAKRSFLAPVELPTDPWTAWTPEQIHQLRRQLKPGRRIKQDPIMTAGPREVVIRESLDKLDTRLISGLL